MLGFRLSLIAPWYTGVAEDEKSAGEGPAETLFWRFFWRRSCGFTEARDALGTAGETPALLCHVRPK